MNHTMLKLEAKTMMKAIAKAKAAHPKVKVISADDRTYAVTGSKGASYTVRFAVANGHKLAECDCSARGMCYHIAAAASVNIGVQSMRRQVASAPEAVPTRASLIADIKRLGGPNLADELLRRFRCSDLNFFSIDILTAIKAALFC